MGTDINYIFQNKVEDENGQVKWETLDLDTELHCNDDYSEFWNGEYYIPRNYTLFAILAGVRNGYGFAGVYRHEPIQPISECRGLPDGMDSWGDYDLGYHDFTWLLGSEILEWFGSKRHVLSRGIIDVDCYDEWRDGGRGEPSCYSAMVGGEFYDESDPNNISWFMVRHFRQYKDIKFVRVEWKEDLDESLNHFKNMICKLVDEYGEIRMVMGFDS